MSHKATNWLAEIEPARLGASEFRVLFHLCDCHNASQGCFPSQAYLRERAGVSNGTVNNVLNALEQKGLIQRHVSRDGKTKRQNPTRYILGFEMGQTQEPSPKYGDGKRGKPSPKSGDGAVSNLRAEPSPIQRPTRLQPTGEEPVNNQKITSAQAREAAFSDATKAEAKDFVAWRRTGGDISTLTPTTRREVPGLIRCAMAEKMIEAEVGAAWLADLESGKEGKTDGS